MTFFSKTWCLGISLLAFLVVSPLLAAPAVIENPFYKINLSETMPGIDDPSLNTNNPFTQPLINVDVLNKTQSSSNRFPLQVYAINEYFLAEDQLNLLCRTTPTSAGFPLYSLIQLNLRSTQDSRQFPAIKKYFFSPDNQFLLVVLDKDQAGKGTSDPIALIRLEDAPPVMGWLYSDKDQVNLFQRVLPDMGSPIVLNGIVGWTGDSLTAAFILSSNAGTPESPVFKDYLACVRLNGDDFKVAVKPVDLSSYQIHTGGGIDRIQMSEDKATFFFNQPNSAGELQGDFQLPQGPNP
jgi:hypothetical protein